MASQNRIAVFLQNKYRRKSWMQCDCHPWSEVTLLKCPTVRMICDDNETPDNNSDGHSGGVRQR